MSQTSYIDIVPELRDQFFSNLQPGDRFTYARVGRKNVLLSRKRKAGVSQKSLLPDCSAAWATLSVAQKAAWTAAGAECNLNGWRLFVQDYCARIINDIAGIATPNLLHQSWVGQLHVEAPATEAKMIQEHPRNYYVYRKVTGTKSMYSPVLVTEDIALPLNLSINYSANLAAAGPDPYAKFYAEVWYSYQGVNLIKTVEIPLTLITDWVNATAVLSSLQTIVIGYNLFIHLHDLQGDLYFDNVKAEHSGQNWVRDPFCKDVNQGFTRNFYQIPKHWAAVISPLGVTFESVYKDF